MMYLFCSINFEVKPGQLVAVAGHCGSGKTSLISALLGEMKKLSGTISYTVRNFLTGIKLLEDTFNDRRIFPPMFTKEIL